MAKLKPGFHSEKHIANQYYQEFGDKLLSGDHLGEWIDEKKEKKYIDTLRGLYGGVIGEPQIAHVTKKNPHELTHEDDNRWKVFKKRMAKRFPWMLGMAALSPINTITGLGKEALKQILINKAVGNKAFVDVGNEFKLNLKANIKPMLKGGLVLGSLVPLATLIGAGYPATDVSKSISRKKVKLNDEQIRDMLRGGVIGFTEKKIKKHYIK